MSLLSDRIFCEAIEDMDFAEMTDNTVNDFFDASEGICESDIMDEIGDEDDTGTDKDFDDNDIIDGVV